MEKKKPNCAVCNDTGKVFIVVSDEIENGWEVCPHCEDNPEVSFCHCCGKSIAHFSEDIIPVYTAPNECGIVICYSCAHEGSEYFLCQNCGEWNKKGNDCLNCGEKGE